jgi:hypothetical protein
MMKTLRFLFVAFMAMVGVSAMAQEKVIDFSGEDNWGIGTTNVTASQSYTYDGMTITLTPSEGCYFRWYTTGNILLGKQGATLQLPAFDFEVSRIDVEGTSGASAAVKQNIFVGEEAVSTETTGAKNVTNQYDINESYQTAGTIYTLKVTSTHNTQITKIKIYKKGSSAKQQPGISWSKANATVTIDGNDNVYPELNNPNNLTVNYTSSKEDVATINNNGVIALVGAGTTTISAIFEGDDTYEAATVSYSLTVKTPAEMKNFVKATTVESGKAYLFVVNVEGALKAAKIITANYGYPGVVDVNEDNNVINADAVNSFVLESTDDGYTIKQSDNRYWYLKGDYRSFNVDAAPTEGQYFDIEIQGDGTVKVTNKSKQKYLQYSTSHTSFGCYDTAQEDGIMPVLYVEGGSTGINTVKYDNSFEDAIYNLNGQRVVKAQKGLYIQNGKKYFVK